jgi:hypothetical protein
MKVPVHLGDLFGPSGNAFFILGQVKRSYDQLGRKGEWPAFLAAATAGDYDNLIATVLEHCEDLDGSIELLRFGREDNDA